MLSIVFCVVDRRAARPGLGLLRRLARPVLVLIMDALFAFPSFLLAIVFSFLLTDIIGGSVLAAALSLTAIYIPQYFRVVRNTTVSAKEATYVEAARAIGASDGVIMRRYLFGNVIQSVPVHRHPQRRRRDRDAGRPRLPRPGHPVRPTPPSGGTTSTARSTTPAPASGGPASTRAWRSCC